MAVTRSDWKDTPMNKKMAAAGLTAGLVAGIGAGAVLQASGSAGAASWSVQATDDTTDSTDDSTTTDDSTATDDSTTDHPDFDTRLQEVLQPLIDDGTLTQAQVDAVIETLAAARPEGGFGGPGHHRGGFALTVVAETIGITEDDVLAGLQSGQTLAEIAEANGSSADAVIQAILADMTERAAAKVAAGEITQAEADEFLANATERVTDMVNNGGPRHGDDDDADATEDSTDTGS